MVIEWTSVLETGNETIDTQHRELITLLNGLIESCANGVDTDRLRDALDFLTEYTYRHFDDEEMLQLMYMYPDYENHKQAHDVFKRKVQDLIARFEESGSTEVLSSDVNKIVAAWFLRHIRLEDVKIGRHILEKRQQKGI